uniref:(northern house mosquito) hypothetical protein n=1 Tax=Culex pipiens TaxID=7175 RepID=A0A8D8F3B1_CULPI
MDDDEGCCWGRKLLLLLPLKNAPPPAVVCPMNGMLLLLLLGGGNPKAEEPCTGLEWMLFIWFMVGAFPPGPLLPPLPLPSRLSRSMLMLPAFFQVVPTGAAVDGLDWPGAVPLPSRRLLLLVAFRGCGWRRPTPPEGGRKDPLVLPSESPLRSDSRSLAAGTAAVGCAIPPNRFADELPLLGLIPKNKSVDGATGVGTAADPNAAKSAKSSPAAGLLAGGAPNADSKSPNSGAAAAAGTSAARGLKSSNSSSLPGLPTDGGPGHVLNRSSAVVAFVSCVTRISSAWVFRWVGELMPRSAVGTLLLVTVPVDLPKLDAAPMSIFLVAFEPPTGCLVTADTVVGALMLRLIFFSPLPRVEPEACEWAETEDDCRVAGLLERSLS